MNDLRRDGRTVYVPAPDSLLRKLIRAGSGIVGTVQTDGRILIDYEGNVYNASNLGSYAERVYHAHDRHTWHGKGYPTSARAFADDDDLIEVGFFDPDSRTVHVDRQDVVDEWLAEVSP